MFFFFTPLKPSHDMLDVKVVREREEVVRDSERKRGKSGKLVDAFLEIDRKYREVVHSREMCQMRKKDVTRDVKKGRRKVTEELKSRLKELKAEISRRKKEEMTYMKSRRDLLEGIGNLVSPEVPVGQFDSVVRYFNVSSSSPSTQKWKELAISHFKDYALNPDIKEKLFNKNILKSDLPQGFLSENGFFSKRSKNGLSFLLVFDGENKDHVMKDILNRIELFFQRCGVSQGCVTSVAASRLEKQSCSEHVVHGKIKDDDTYIPLASISYCSDYHARKIRCFCGGSKFKIGGVFMKHHCHFVIGHFLDGIRFGKNLDFLRGNEGSVCTLSLPKHPISFNNPCDEECTRLNFILRKYPYLNGFDVSKLDRETFSRFQSGPPRSHFVSLCRWFRNISSHDAGVRRSWD